MSSKRARRRTTTAGYQAGPGTVVTLDYELFDAEGEHVERSDPASPLVLLLGYGEAAPALEQALSGLSEGETKDVSLAAEDAFGARDTAAVIEVDRAEFPPDVAPGDELEAEREGGGFVALKVLEVADDVVVLDTNHPLAGQRVRLRITLKNVRPASPDEISRATDRLLEEAAPAPAPLLPAERLLRRVRGEPSAECHEPKAPRDSGPTRLT